MIQGPICFQQNIDDFYKRACHRFSKLRVTLKDKFDFFMSYIAGVKRISSFSNTIKPSSLKRSEKEFLVVFEFRHNRLCDQINLNVRYSGEIL